MADRVTDRTTGISLGRLFGIEVRLDWTLLFMFALITANLGAGLFPQQHPHWSGTVLWVVAVLAALLFLASVLAHELAHALVGRRYGVGIEGITLFIFGGIARMSDEPKSPRAEFAMTVVGPLTSLAIGVLALMLAFAAAGTLPSQDQLSALPRLLGPAATLLFWLGPINILLAFFNLLPAFPLDGGRILRAVLWYATGDLVKATRWSTGLGRIIAALLVFAGVLMIFGRAVPVLGGGVVQGLWLVFIGWFLDGAAVRAYQATRLDRVVQGLAVSRLMKPVSGTITKDAPVSAVADQFLQAPTERCLPVVDGDNLLGIVCLPDLNKVPRKEWRKRTATDIMTPLAKLELTSPSEDATQALRKLARQDVDQLPVVEEGKVLGLLRRADLIRWIELQGGASA